MCLNNDKASCGFHNGAGWLDIYLDLFGFLDFSIDYFARDTQKLKLPIHFPSLPFPSLLPSHPITSRETNPLSSVSEGRSALPTSRNHSLKHMLVSQMS